MIDVKNLVHTNEGMANASRCLAFFPQTPLSRDTADTAEHICDLDSFTDMAKTASKKIVLHISSTATFFCGKRFEEKAQA